VPDLGSKAIGVVLQRGDRIVMSTPGGGGYGNRADRTDSDIERDLRLGYVTKTEQ